MSFQPVIPMSGLGGWKFLQSTYAKQLQGYTDSPQVRRERDYLTEKLSEPLAVEDFIKDKRLLRAALTAYDLAGEEWKGGYITKVLKEVADPESTFLARLNNPKYTAFAEAFTPIGGKVMFSETALAQMAVRFEQNAFQMAVGQIDDSMRLSLNYKTDIERLVGNGSSDQAMLYRLLGDLPVSNLLKTALNLPTDVTKLPIERQAELLKAGIQKTLGISNLSDMAQPDKVDRMIERYHLMQTVNEGMAAMSSASIALTLLGNAGNNYGYGSQASQNLFMSLVRR